MTITQFLKTFQSAVKKNKDIGEWKVVRKNGVLRFFCDNHIYCPITFLYFVEKGVSLDHTDSAFYLGNVFYFGKELHLRKRDLTSIIRAADEKGSKKLRIKMVDIVSKYGIFLFRMDRLVGG